MNTPTHIHHINFIVKDLEVQVKRYQEMLGLGEFEFEELPARGVATARILLGQTWLVLVSPLQADSLPGRYLQYNGEGFFLLSLGIKGLDAALKEYEARGVIAPNTAIRSGLMDWRVVDLDTQDALGARFHLTETEA